MMYLSMQNHITQALTVAEARDTHAPDQQLLLLRPLDVCHVLGYINASMLPQ